MPPFCFSWVQRPSRPCQLVRRRELGRPAPIIRLHNLQKAQILDIFLDITQTLGSPLWATPHRSERFGIIGLGASNAAWRDLRFLPWMPTAT